MIVKWSLSFQLLATLFQVWCFIFPFIIQNYSATDCAVNVFTNFLKVFHLFVKKSLEVDAKERVASWRKLKWIWTLPAERDSHACQPDMFANSQSSCFSEFKDNERLRSIIRYSLQPMENPDTVLYPEVENWYDTEGSSSSPPRDASSAKEGKASSWYCWII